LQITVFDNIALTKVMSVRNTPLPNLKLLKQKW